MTRLDDFTWSYVDCALWSSTDDDSKPLDSCFRWEDIDPKTLAKMVADCQRFQAENEVAIAGMDSRAGHDFWLTRNGHGAGFWDGDWPDTVEDQLTDAAKAFGEFDLYVGDDGLIYGQYAGRTL